MCAGYTVDKMTKINFKEKTMWTRDNLPIMRGMNSECVDLIYLDPPFNSNVLYQGLPGEKNITAAFMDVWKLTEEDEIWHQSIKKTDRCLYEVIEASRYAHSESMMSYLIVMSERLFEMHRILKPTGGIYLHCDPTAEHYLKIIMDCIFGHKNFRNEISWVYGKTARGAKAISRAFAKNSDTILWYTKTDDYTFNNTHYERKVPLKGSGYRKDPDGRCFRTSPRGDYTDESVEKLRKEGRIHETKNGNIRIKYYERCDNDFVYEKKLTGNVWDDIPDMMHTGQDERTGYPTQKPLRLLERIIEASSNENDLILDPFCGCATALVAAEKLNRNWAGIDISYIANQLVKLRMRRETNLFDNYDVIERSDIPSRTDISGGDLKDVDIKQQKYEKQEGKCAGCGYPLPKRYLTKDRIVPGAKGGQYTEENIQLLCQPCNSTKGKNDMPFLIKRLQEQDLIYKEDKESGV